jgi:hypothetical protein
VSATSLPTEARFPGIALGKGHYESFYAKLSHPTRPVGIWIRYTVHKRGGELPQGSLWFTLFDREAGGPKATKVTLPSGHTGAGAGHYIHVGTSRFWPGGLSGDASSEGVSASWDLRFDAGARPFRHLPRPWMYAAPIPRTKLLSPHPATRFTGQVEVDGTQIDVDGWPGMVGHNWGAQHAERWIWMHGTGFSGHEPDGTWLDAALGRIKLGPVTTPWIANAMLVLDGVEHRLGGPERVRATKVGEGPTRCEFTLPGERVEVHGRVEAPNSDFVGWVYADPDGSEHNTVNCSIAAMALTVREKGGGEVKLETEWGAAYELGMRERDHGIPIQAFPDG